MWPQVRKAELEKELRRWTRTLTLIRKKDGDVVNTSQVNDCHNVEGGGLFVRD